MLRPFFIQPLRRKKRSALKSFIDIDSQLHYHDSTIKQQALGFQPCLRLAKKGAAMSDDEMEQLSREHGALMLNYREVQQRCSAQIQSLARQVQALSQQLVRTRAQLIARDSALAWERELRQTLVAQQLTAWLSSASTSVDPASLFNQRAMPATPQGNERLEQQLLENSLQAADLVICQSGCISDGAFWRVQDHCKRTGKPCVLLDASSNALHVVQLHSGMEDDSPLPAFGNRETA